MYRSICFRTVYLPSAQISQQTNERTNLPDHLSMYLLPHLPISVLRSPYLFTCLTTRPFACLLTTELPLDSAADLQPSYLQYLATDFAGATSLPGLANDSMLAMLCTLRRPTPSPSESKAHLWASAANNATLDSPDVTLQCDLNLKRSVGFRPWPEPQVGPCICEVPKTYKVTGLAVSLAVHHLKDLGLQPCRAAINQPGMEGMSGHAIPAAANRCSVTEVGELSQCTSAFCSRHQVREAHAVERSARAVT